MILSEKVQYSLRKKNLRGVAPGGWFGSVGVIVDCEGECVQDQKQEERYILKYPKSSEGAHGMFHT